MRAELRMYRRLKDVQEEEQAAAEAASRKTYWDKYPELKLLRKVNKKRCAVYLFFAYWFMLSTGEYSGFFSFGCRWLIVQLVMTAFVLSAAMCFDYSIRNMRILMMIPFMSVVMGGLSCYICLFALIIFTFSTIPPYSYVAVVFHCFLFFVSSIVTLTLAKGTDYLWQGFFTMIDLAGKEEILEKLRTDAVFIEEVDTGKKKKKKSGPAMLSGRRF